MSLRRIISAFKKCIYRLNHRYFIYILLMVLLFPLAQSSAQSLQEMNGFIIEKALVPAKRIINGGPGRDGIPSIDKPVFIAGQNARLKDSDKVLGLNFNGVQKAYPVNILNYHELVNDNFNGHTVTVSFCPLCGTGMVFDTGLAETSRSFGVSGLLYNSDLLMYDRETLSLWSQVEGRAISGSEKGKTLKQLPVEHTIWRDWKARFPNTRVLSEQTGYRRNYARSPYPGYNQREQTYFPVAHQNSKYHPKTWVLGLNVKGIKKAYPFVELAKTSGRFIDTLGQKKFQIIYNHQAKSARVEDEKGQPLTSITAFWFAWIAFHPETLIFEAPRTFCDCRSLINKVQVFR